MQYTREEAERLRLAMLEAQDQYEVSKVIYSQYILKLTEQINNRLEEE